MIVCNGLKIHAEVSHVISDLIREGLLDSKTSVKNDYILVCCPYHNERKPSSSLTTHTVERRDKVVPTGYFNCFACHAKGNLFEFISQCLGKQDGGFVGIKWLREHFIVEEELGSNVKLQSNLTHRTRRRQQRHPIISDEILDTYRNIHPYMYERHLVDDYIEFFDIGYDVNTNALTFPVKDLQGNVCYISRRSVKSRFHIQEENNVKTDFVWGAYECIQEIERMGAYEEVFICESVLNAIRYWQIGKLAVALMGTGGGNQYRILSRIPASYFIASLDCDKAGRHGTDLLYKSEYLKDFNIRQIKYPEWVEKEGKDINDLTDEEIMNLTYDWYIGERKVLI